MTYKLNVQRVNDVKVSGIVHGKARLVAENLNFIVVKFAGYSYSSGSRNSGLGRQYVNAETVVYRVVERQSNGWIKCERDVVSW